MEKSYCVLFVFGIFLKEKREKKKAVGKGGEAKPARRNGIKDGFVRWVVFMP